MTYVAWIPILTPNIDFERRVNDFIEQNKEYIENKKSSPNEIIYKREFDDVRINNEGEQKIKITLHNFKITEIYFNEIKLAEIHHISDEGIVWFSLSVSVADDFTPQKLAGQVYIVIKDIYHVHTHHNKEDDMLLVPCKIGGTATFKIDNLVALKILNQYTEKIIKYHKIIHSINEDNEIATISQMRLLLLLFKKAKGEMIYGLHFLSLVKSSISTDLYNNHKKAFQNSLTSMGILSDNLELQQNKTNISLFIISIIISIIGFYISLKPIKIILFLFIFTMLGYYIRSSFIGKAISFIEKVINWVSKKKKEDEKKTGE